MDDRESGRMKLSVSNEPMDPTLYEKYIQQFNAKKASGNKCDLRECDLRGLDLLALNTDGPDFTDCYCRQSDVRGIDLRKAKLDGTSINLCKIFGVFFPGH